tara:strand:- start:3589 stop:5583 length:1995 start_codon:yes stop_codon:yes gene_type:complete
MAIEDYTNPNLFGTPKEEEDEALLAAEDAMIGGLGLGGAAYAAQTGQLPTATPQGPLSPFAQQVRANDAARLAAQNRPSLIGTGSSTSGVTNPRLVPGTRIVPTGQPPAVTSTGGAPAVTSTGGPPATTSGSAVRSARDFAYNVNRGNRFLNRLRRGGPSILGAYTLADIGTELATGRGISERIGEGGGEAVGNLLYPGAENQPAFTEAELQQSRDNLSTPAQLDILQGDIESSIPQVNEVTPLQAGLGALDEEIAGRESNIVSNQVELAKQINELGTVTDEQRAAQDFLNERAERAFEKPTDVITPFQEQAELTADLFTDPNTAIGQFVPRQTFTLPDGTIIQEDEGGNRREISAEQLRQFEQDMSTTGQDSVVGLGRGGDAGVIKSFDRPMGPEETQAALGGMTLNEYLNAPAGTPGASGLRTDPQGRMITPNPQPANTQAPANQLSSFEQDSLSRQQRIGGTGSFEGDSEAREARLRAEERQPGESQADRDTRVAQNRTTAGQTEGMSFDDARRRAEGQLAAQGVRNPTASQINSLARAIQAGETERLTDLALKRDLTQSRIDASEAQLAQAGIVPEGPPVVDPKTGVITQEYSDGTTRFKGVGRSPSGGDINLDGFVPGGDQSELPEALKNSNPADFNGQTVKDKQGNRYSSDGTKWIKI